MTEGYQEENGWMERKAAVAASGKLRGFTVCICDELIRERVY